MRKGAKKRSASQRAAAHHPDQLTEDAPVVTPQASGGGHAGGPQPKRARASRKGTESAEPEFFEDKRNLEDLWMAAFPVGTEWDQLDNVYQIKWNFSNLEEAFEEGGKLYGKRVYVFGCTEPQLVSYRGESKIMYVPAVVAVDHLFSREVCYDVWNFEVVSPFPPSDKIGIKSVQREFEEIVPMKQMKMDWVPYIPFEDRGRQVDRLKSEIFIMSCTQRRAALKHLKIDRVKKYEYCLPYFNDPLKEDEDEQSTVVPILFPSEPKPVFCEYDWEFDEYEDFIENLIKEEELSEDQREAFKAYLKEKVREGKKANREAREARKNALDKMSEETRSAFENMKIYKFYPVQTPDSPDISNCKVPFVNRYYRKAHEVL